MELLSRVASISSPAVYFDPDNGQLTMSGESYPENTFEFYAPIISWLKTFIAEKDLAITLNLELAYLNTGSVKCLMDIFDLLEDAFQEGRKISVIWRYHQKNSRALETAEEFSEDLTLPFQIEAL
ncbi:MAG: DUF1987 domain-containing protein [Gammaproteobacteria bacterium]|uniref:SiaC family regulatory phosphoprotein domain-containing protein n=1 Tax=Tolumonas osonensis TaxID=675874 RepID=A0A841G8X5_9GAMM|nr:biofilm regulation phosphoprotein SiaC [Tolumonas osonensis]MBB6055584.1 hypothetical protein [Tolumonas osonensis]NCB61230.1 DUF1987 domain-containing protein [Gammaproteobacteria bacterium]